MKLHISGISHLNDHLLNDLAGIAGLKNRVTRTDECHAAIDLNDYVDVGQDGTDVLQMIGAYVLHGFTVVPE